MTENAAMNDANYADWTWETVLGTVLNITMPDRGAVTMQPWLVIRHGGGTLPGAHEFWNASWTASSIKAPGAISVYLNPALNDPEGPASMFQAAPGALAGVPDRAYSTPAYGPLPMQPPAFQPVGLAVADVADWFGTAARQFHRMRQSAQASLSGEASQMFADLFGRLGAVAASLHEQMSDPISYADAILDTAAGTAASFLASLWSAYRSWTQQPAYTPAGAIVQALQALGQLQPDGTYMINDPERTIYGDLTTDQGWAALERQAKNLWLSLLTTGTDSFGGLDPLAHSALSSLISQYDSAINVLQPVTGASRPAGQRLLGQPPPGGPDHVSAVIRPSPSIQNESAARDPLNASAGGPGPGSLAGFAVGGPGAINLAAASAGGPAAAAAAAEGPATSKRPATSTLVPAAALLVAAPAATLAARPAVVSGAIGAVSNDTSRALGDEAPTRALPGPALAYSALIPGAIGKTSVASGQRKRSGSKAPSPNKADAGARLAPVAGAALGRGGEGPVLTQARVPALSAKPPPIRSSAINTQLTATVTSPKAAAPAETLRVGSADVSGASGAPGGAPGRLSGRPEFLIQAAGLVHAPPGAPGGTPAPRSDATRHDMITTLMMQQTGGDFAGGNGPMMAPQATLGIGFGGDLGGRSGGQQTERERRSYRPEDEESWGVTPEERDAALGAPRKVRQVQPHLPEEAEESEIPNRFGAIGRPGRPADGPHA